MRKANLTLIPHPEETGESMARRLTKMMLKEGLFKTMKARASHEKPSVKKRRKAEAAMKRYRKTRDASGELKVRVAAEERRFGG